MPHSKRVQRLASVNFYCIETQKIAFFDLHITAQHASQNSSQYRRNVRCFVLEIALTIQCSVFYIYHKIQAFFLTIKSKHKQNSGKNSLSVSLLADFIYSLDLFKD